MGGAVRLMIDRGRRLIHPDRVIGEWDCGRIKILALKV